MLCDLDLVPRADIVEQGKKFRLCLGRGQFFGHMVILTVIEEALTDRLPRVAIIR
jgi:hypothetical protein